MRKCIVHAGKQFHCWACLCDLNEGDEYYVVTMGMKASAKRSLDHKTRIVPLCPSCFEVWNKGRPIEEHS